jgi:hypothetical protein
MKQIQSQEESITQEESMITYTNKTHAPSSSELHPHPPPSTKPTATEFRVSKNHNYKKVLKKIAQEKRNHLATLKHTHTHTHLNAKRKEKKREKKLAAATHDSDAFTPKHNLTSVSNTQKRRQIIFSKGFLFKNCFKCTQNLGSTGHHLW